MRRSFGLAAFLVVLAGWSAAPGQEPGVEVLARGPVHEAYAATAEHPTAGPIVPKMPPGPIEELPPDQKPEGGQWISGYWHWDEDRTDFIWVSGFWRVPPPSRVWVPGSWREVRGGFQWVHGFWQTAVPQAPQQELEYLPPPPAPLELAPSVPSPAPTCFYVPGSWTWRGRYVWRPGFWVEHRPNWVWVPTHYRWTPAGYVCVEGYWDHPLDGRGVLFAPVVVSPALYARPTFVYSPTYAVAHTGMVSALFVRRGWGCYYFGDYFEPRYTTLGFNAWCGTARGGNFAISVGVGRAAVYDPLWSYYQVAHRHDPVWVNNVTNVYVGRYRGDVPRPPRTLVQQNTVVNNVTNITNVTNNNVTFINNPQTMVAPMAQVQQANPALALKAVPRSEQLQEQTYSKQLAQVASQRRQLETSLADRQLTPQQPTDRPRQAKLDLPQQVVARAAAPTPSKAPPPLPSPNQQAELRSRAPASIPPAIDTSNPRTTKPLQQEPGKPTLTVPQPGVPTNPMRPTLTPPGVPTKPLQVEKPNVTTPNPTVPTKPTGPTVPTKPVQVEKPNVTTPTNPAPVTLPNPKPVVPAVPTRPTQVEKPQVPAQKPTLPPATPPAPIKLPPPAPSQPMKPTLPPPAPAKPNLPPPAQPMRSIPQPAVPAKPTPPPARPTAPVKPTAPVGSPMKPASTQPTKPGPVKKQMG